MFAKLAGGNDVVDFRGISFDNFTVKEQGHYSPIYLWLETPVQ